MSEFHEPPDREQATLYLTRNVLPVLEQAAERLASTGVTAVVETSWSQAQADAPPSVSFYCGERGVGSGANLARGEVAEFTFSDGMLGVSAAGGSLERVRPEQDKQAVHDAVNRVVARYYADLEDSVR